MAEMKVYEISYEGFGNMVENQLEICRENSYDNDIEITYKHIDETPTNELANEFVEYYMCEDKEDELMDLLNLDEDEFKKLVQSDKVVVNY